MNEETRNQSDEMSQQNQHSMSVDPQTNNKEEQTQRDCLGYKEIENEIVKLQKIYSELEKNISEKLEEQKNLIQNIVESNKKDNEDSDQSKNNQLDSILDKLKGIDQIDLILNKLEGIDQLDSILDKLKGIDQLDLILNKLEGIDRIDPILSKLEGIDQLAPPILDKLQGIETILSNELRDEVTQKLGKIETDMERIPTKIDNILNVASTIKTLFEGFEGKASSSTGNTREIPPSNEDDETILGLADYGQKIFQQLTNAARHYAQNREDIDAVNQMKREYENKINNAGEEYYKKGQEEGGRKILENFLTQYQDLDEFFANDEILSEDAEIDGLEQDQRFVKGEHVEITDKNKSEYEEVAHFESCGKYEVLKSCYKYKGEVIQYAELKALE
ncbi:MAG: hypothetical protein ACMUIP_16740 [bacterium]